MKMKPLTLSLGCLAACAAVAALILWFWPANNIKGLSASIQRRTPNYDAPIVGGDTRPLPPRHRPAGSVDYRISFSKSHNYWEFAHSILAAANAGNADAQFFLSKAIAFCDQANKMYFELDGKKLSLDEGLKTARQLRQPPEAALAIFERCHQFQESDASELGTSQDWLAKATDAGQPLAQASTATQMLMQKVFRGTKGAAPTPENTAPLIGNGMDPDELLRAALRSRDPEVMYTIGLYQGLLGPRGSEVTTNGLAWKLVACQQGFDCSAGADWVKFACGIGATCDTSSPEGLIRSFAGDDWPNVQQRALEISAQVDAGLWNELGLYIMAREQGSEETITPAVFAPK
jgi:hypothetical protein